MHVDVVATGTRVQVVACGATVHTHGTVFSGIKIDIRNGAVVGEEVCGVIKVNIGTPSPSVQVAFAIDEVCASIVGYKVIGAPVVRNFVRDGASTVADVKVGDVAPVKIIIAAFYFIKQVDVVTTGICVEVLFNHRPPLFCEGGFEIVRLGTRAADDHHITDVVRGVGLGSREQGHEQEKAYEKGAGMFHVIKVLVGYKDKNF